MLKPCAPFIPSLNESLSHSLPHRGLGHRGLLQHDPRGQIRPGELLGRHRLLHGVERGQREPRRRLQVMRVTDACAIRIELRGYPLTVTLLGTAKTVTVSGVSLYPNIFDAQKCLCSYNVSL